MRCRPSNETFFLDDIDFGQLYSPSPKIDAFCVCLKLCQSSDYCICLEDLQYLNEIFRRYFVVLLSPNKKETIGDTHFGYHLMSIICECTNVFQILFQIVFQILFPNYYWRHSFLGIIWGRSFVSVFQILFPVNTGSFDIRYQFYFCYYQLLLSKLLQFSLIWVKMVFSFWNNSIIYEVLVVSINVCILYIHISCIQSLLTVCSHTCLDNK